MFSTEIRSGGLFLDQKGVLLYIFAGPSQRRTCIFTEFEAFLLACRVLNNHWKNKKAIICSDSSSLVDQFMKFKVGLLGSHIQNLDFSSYELDFHLIWAKHIHRSLNQEADFLAKTGASRNRLVAGKV